jgi:hypothetical protein
LAQFQSVPLSKVDLAQNVGPKFLGCNWGTISIKQIIGEKIHGRSSGTSYLSNTALAQTHRSSSMASSWLNFFEQKKTKKKLEKIEPATSL